jgi:hypothetical protein
VERARKRGLRISEDEHVTFVVGQETIAPESHKTSLIKRLRILAYNKISNNTQGKIEYYNLPPDNTLEVGGESVLSFLVFVCEMSQDASNVILNRLEVNLFSKNPKSIKMTKRSACLRGTLSEPFH